MDEDNVGEASRQDNTTDKQTARCVVLRNPSSIAQHQIFLLGSVELSANFTSLASKKQLRRPVPFDYLTLNTAGHDSSSDCRLPARACLREQRTQIHCQFANNNWHGTVPATVQWGQGLCILGKKLTPRRPEHTAEPVDAAALRAAPAARHSAVPITLLLPQAARRVAVPADLPPVQAARSMAVVDESPLLRHAP